VEIAPDDREWGTDAGARKNNTTVKLVNKAASAVADKADKLRSGGIEIE
jgi:hypothetical protein